MSMRDFTKAEKKQLRTLASEAYRRELYEELRDLDSVFADWRNRNVDEFALAEAIHGFHDGPSRDLYALYGRMDPGYLVGRAVGRRILDESDLPAKILENLTNLVKFAREHADDPSPQTSEHRVGLASAARLAQPTSRSDTDPFRAAGALPSFYSSGRVPPRSIARVAWGGGVGKEKGSASQRDTDLLPTSQEDVRPRVPSE